MFTLRAGSEPIGELEYDHREMYWVHCKWQPLQAFQRHREFFAHELHLLETDNIGELEELWERQDASNDRYNIVSDDCPGVQLITDLMIHIDQDAAWFTGDPGQLNELGL